jgi:two-component system NtrC family response regulator
MLKVCRTVERLAGVSVLCCCWANPAPARRRLPAPCTRWAPREEVRRDQLRGDPETLLIELFGHEKGAFTGAVRQVQGRIEQANGGTLFLDEIGEMPITLQAKLLRFLQDQVFERVGGRQAIKVDVRVVSATNQPLEEQAAEGSSAATCCTG